MGERMLNPHEKNALKIGFACMSFSSEESEHLKKGMQELGKWGLYKAHIAGMEKCLMTYLLDMDAHAAESLLKDIKNKMIRLVPRPLTEHNGNDRIELAREDLLALVEGTIEGQCRMCPYEGDLNAMKACPQRKAMDALSLSVGNDQANRPCVYALTLAREKKKAAKKAKKKRR